MKGSHIVTIMVLSLLCSSCKDKTVDEPFCDRYEPGKLLVGTKAGANLEELFYLAGYYQLQIDEVAGNMYESSLPGSQIDEVIDYLNSKDYINHNGFKAVKGGSVSVHYQTNRLVIACVLWNMTPENQRDWISTKSLLKLTDKSVYRYMVLNVPEGQEKRLARTLSKFENISSAELNCYLEIVPNY